MASNRNKTPNSCIFCESRDIEPFGDDFSREIACQYFVCHSCKGTWACVFKLHRTEKMRKPGDKNADYKQRRG